MRAISRQADGVDLVRLQVGGGVRPDQGPIQLLPARQLPDPGAVVRARARGDLIGNEGPEADEGRSRLLGDHLRQLGGEGLPVGVGPAGVRALSERRQQRPVGVGTRQHVVQLLHHALHRGGDGAAALGQAAAHAGLHLRQRRRDRPPAGDHDAPVGRFAQGLVGRHERISACRPQVASTLYACASARSSASVASVDWRNAASVSACSGSAASGSADSASRRIASKRAIRAARPSGVRSGSWSLCPGAPTAVACSGSASSSACQ